MAQHDEVVRGAPGDQRKGTEADHVRVISLPGERLEEAAGLLTHCFHQDPNSTGLRDAKGGAQAEKGER